jgi:purine-nucleoside phosphorylase
MTPHIEAQTGAYHDTVLMPGDPLRAKWIAENFLEDAVLVNSVRNCLGYSGTYKGKHVSVQASGMGQASLGIYVHELFKEYDVKNIIRVGSCGAISPNLTVGDIVVAMSSATDNAMTDNLAPGFRLSPCCDYYMLEKYMRVDPSAYVGQMVSNDYFYQPNLEWFKPLRDMGILAVDMETHVLYSIANRFNKKALSINTVSDHLEKNMSMSSEERERGLGVMIENVLRSIL